MKFPYLLFQAGDAVCGGGGGGIIVVVVSMGRLKRWRRRGWIPMVAAPAPAALGEERRARRRRHISGKHPKYEVSSDPSITVFYT